MKPTPNSVVCLLGYGGGSFDRAYYRTIRWRLRRAGHRVLCFREMEKAEGAPLPPRECVEAILEATLVVGFRWQNSDLSMSLVRLARMLGTPCIAASELVLD